MKKVLLILLIFSLLFSGCENWKKKAANEAMKSMQPVEQVQLDESEKYHAVVEEEMTLKQVADTNNMAESYLKQKLGIAHYVKHPYTVLELSRNYQFTVDDLKWIIEDYKDSKTARNKSKITPENK